MDDISIEKIKLSLFNVLVKLWLISIDKKKKSYGKFPHIGLEYF